MSTDSWSLGMMASFDLETTGVDPETARIVTACIALIDGTGFEKPDIETWLVNPGIEIPAQATAIHGITSEIAKAEGSDPAESVREMSMLLADYCEAGYPIIAFNAPYDFTVLDRECRRHDVPTISDRCADDRLGFYVIDPLVLDKHVDKFRRGKRSLEAACQHYGVRIDGAHDASHDALAAARVAWRIAQMHPAIAAMRLSDLHDLQVEAKREQAASFREHLRSQGKPCDDVCGDWPMVPYQAVAA